MLILYSAYHISMIDIYKLEFIMNTYIINSRIRIPINNTNGSKILKHIVDFKCRGYLKILQEGDTYIRVRLSDISNISKTRIYFKDSVGQRDIYIN